MSYETWSQCLSKAKSPALKGCLGPLWFRNIVLQLANCFDKGGYGLRNVHTPGPAEKAGKSSKSIMKSADASPHEDAVAVAAVLETLDVFEFKREEKI